MRGLICDVISYLLCLKLWTNLIRHSYGIHDVINKTIIGRILTVSRAKKLLLKASTYKIHFSDFTEKQSAYYDWLLLIDLWLPRCRHTEWTRLHRVDNCAHSNQRENIRPVKFHCQYIAHHPTKWCLFPDRTDCVVLCQSFCNVKYAVSCAIKRKPTSMTENDQGSVITSFEYTCT